MSEGSLRVRANDHPMQHLLSVHHISEQATSGFIEIRLGCCGIRDHNSSPGAVQGDKRLITLLSKTCPGLRPFDDGSQKPSKRLHQPHLVWREGTVGVVRGANQGPD